MVDDLIARGATVEITNAADADAAVAEALTRRHAARRERAADMTADAMPASYVVATDSWPHMKAQLLAQMLANVGSIRRLSKVLDVPRSTLGAWISEAKRDGTWPCEPWRK